MIARKKIFLLDDHPVVLAGLRGLLSRRAEWEVIGEAGDPPAAWRVLETHVPDLAIVDLQLREYHGLDFIRHLQSRHPAVRVMVLTASEDPDMAHRCLRVGVHGFMTKYDMLQNLYPAVETILAGRCYVTGGLAGNLLGRRSAGAADGEASVIRQLSGREWQVFQHLGHGEATGAIATRLGLSRDTVYTYEHRISEKLGARDGADLRCRAIRWFARE